MTVYFVESRDKGHEDNPWETVVKHAFTFAADADGVAKIIAKSLGRDFEVRVTAVR